MWPSTQTSGSQAPLDERSNLCNFALLGQGTRAFGPCFGFDRAACGVMCGCRVVLRGRDGGGVVRPSSGPAAKWMDLKMGNRNDTNGRTTSQTVAAEQQESRQPSVPALAPSGSLSHPLGEMEPEHMAGEIVDTGISHGYDRNVPEIRSNPVRSFKTGSSRDASPWRQSHRGHTRSGNPTESKPRDRSA